MIEKRRKTTVEERVGNCEICSYPLVQLHHVLEFTQHGNSNITIWLCANCHALLHLAISAIIYHKQRSTKVWNAFCAKVGEENSLVVKIKNKVYETAEIALETYYNSYERDLEL